MVDSRHRLAQGAEGGPRLPGGGQSGFEIAHPVAVGLFDPSEPFTKVGLALLEPVDRSLPLLGVALCHRSIEYPAADATLVSGWLPGLRCAGLAAQLGIERPHAGADTGVAEVDTDRVVAEVPAHPWGRRVEPGEGAQAGHLALGVDEEGVVVGDYQALGGDLVEDRGVVALPQRQAQRVGVLVATLE